MNTKRDEVLAMIADPDQREFLRRFADEVGIAENDDRWEFVKLLQEIPPEDRDSVFETIGRMSYNMTDEEITAWRERIDKRTAPITAAIKADMAFERAEKISEYTVEQAVYMHATGKSARDVALEGLSQEARDRVIAEAASVGIVAQYDVGWFLIGSQLRCWAATQASGEAAKEVAKGVADIPKTILKGALQASKTVRNDIKDVIDKSGTALLAAIDVAAQAGSAAIAAGSTDLISKLDAAVEAKKQEGVSAFARAAAEAAVAAANAASATVLSENKVKLRRSALAMALIFLVYAGLGWAANSEYLSLTHQITPAPMVINPKTGKPNCGKITTPTGREEVCEIR